MTDQKDLVPAAREFLVFVADDGTAQVRVRIADGTVWLTQKQMAVLYGKDVRTINEHLGNVYLQGELEPEATIRKFRMVRTERNRTVSRQVAPWSSTTACRRSSRSAIAFGRPRGRGSGSGPRPGSMSTWSRAS